MKELRELIGREVPIDRVCQVLRGVVEQQGGALVGAHHVTCSDETEQESLEVFHASVVRPLLPTLDLAQQADFRTANLGARYEWGSIRIAEHHFATRESANSFKVMLLKINAHVSRETTSKGSVYGRLDRYGEVSDCCGALFALMAGKRLPAVDEIREVFAWEGRDRAGAVSDPSRVPEPLRGLVAAVVQARLQARLAVIDIRDHRPHTPTVYLVVPSVTINVPRLDEEIVCGVYVADMRGERPAVEYTGLGDDPDAFVISHKGGTVRITDTGIDQTRRSRDHRQLPLRRWLERRPETDADPVDAETAAASAPDGSDRLRQELDRMVAAAPVETALRLFAAGMAPVHHVLRADRISRDPVAAWEIRAILDDVRTSFAGLSDEGMELVSSRLAQIAGALGHSES
jgi:hypothetical protein